MKNNTIALKVFRDGDHLFDKTFDGADHDVVKIGKLRSSHLCLDGDLVARMHAVLEFNREEGAWRLIDLGSYSGSVLDGAKIERNAKLPEKGLR